MASNSFIQPSTPFDRRRLGKYEVLCRLSTGGMSAIYLAHQTGLAGFKKLVVLKTILPDIGGEEDFVGMFLEEARITAVFNHPNIAQVFELDTDDGQLFIAMEFVQGCTLVEMARACRQAKEPIPVGFTLTSTRDTALALHYAHNFTDVRGRKQIVIHRDVAEKNIMVTYEGVTKLLDFGIAKALGRTGRTTIGMVKGTSGYMSPEQIRGEPLDPRSDVFGLGVVMHECLTGLRLFHGKTAEEGMMAALREEVQPPSKWNKTLSPEIDAVVLKALQREREKRFSTALEFARAIEKAAPGLIWHPEQCGELVTRHFADRRVETRRLLESTEVWESTGEIRVENVMQQVRASAAAAAGPEPKPTEAPKRPSASHSKQATAGAPAAPTTPAPPAAPPAAAAASGSGSGSGSNKATPAAAPTRDESPTNPARPRALRTLTPSTPIAARAVPPGSPAPAKSEFDDDREDKTIPATALPEEIKNLRERFAAARKAVLAKNSAEKEAKAATASAVTPAHDEAAAARAAAKTAESAIPVPEGLDLTPAPERPLPDVPPPAVSSPARPPPASGNRSASGDTVSVTNASEWDDDEGVKTAIAKPNELPGMMSPRASAKRPPPSPLLYSSVPQPIPAHEPGAEPSGEPEGATVPPSEPAPSESLEPAPAVAAPPPRSLGPLLLLMVLIALAIVAVLMLLDVIPTPRFGGSTPAPVGVQARLDATSRPS